MKGVYCMECKHKQFKCTNNVFYCITCGAVLPDPYHAVKDEGEQPKPAEAQKTGRKRKTELNK